MARARDRTAWNHTAGLMARMHNENPYGKGTARVSDFHPYLKSAPRGIPLTPEVLHLLKPAFDRKAKGTE